MAVLLGCIADDFTGGTDLSGTLVKCGMRTVQMLGVPSGPPPEDVDAIVVALKSRTVAVESAVADSLASLRALQAAGCRQVFFKYCSTFDSTPRGNIGPVAEALLDALGADFTVACPAFPANGRTIYKGHLFVGDQLLSDSGMRDHPLTPMRDASLVRVLQQQVHGTVGLVDVRTVERGAAAVRERFSALRAAGCAFAVLDALSDDHLLVLGEACADLPLVTAGSGLALGLAPNFARRGLLSKRDAADVLPPTGGYRAVIAGSCSQATRRQVAAMRATHPAFRIDPLELARGRDLVSEALEWASARVQGGPMLVYATDGPEALEAVHAELGAARAGELVESALSHIAAGLVALGVGQLIVAGGETSGAVANRLGVRGLRIGPEIDPGVPWTSSVEPLRAGQPLALALKSGNFGTDDFFLKAWSRLS